MGGGDRVSWEGEGFDSKELDRAVERNAKLQVEPKLGGGHERKG